MKNISFLSETFQFLEVKFSMHLNRRVFVMSTPGQLLSIILYCVLKTGRNGTEEPLDQRIGKREIEDDGNKYMTMQK